MPSLSMGTAGAKETFGISIIREHYTIKIPSIIASATMTRSCSLWDTKAAAGWVLSKRLALGVLDSVIGVKRSALDALNFGIEGKRPKDRV